MPKKIPPNCLSQNRCKGNCPALNALYIWGNLSSRPICHLSIMWIWIPSVHVVQTVMKEMLWASYQLRKIAGCAYAGNAGNVFPCHRRQRKPLVSDPDMHHGTCVAHVSWCMSVSLTRGGMGNVPVIPGACANLNFTYLSRGPWHNTSDVMEVLIPVPLMTDVYSGPMFCQQYFGEQPCCVSFIWSYLITIKIITTIWYQWPNVAVRIAQGKFHGQVMSQTNFICKTFQLEILTVYM